MSKKSKAAKHGARKSVDSHDGAIHISNGVQAEQEGVLKPDDKHKGDAPMEFSLKALTNIYTGDVEGNNTKLRLTGIKGSIRWWYEAVVRGLGGYACDPTGADKCELVKDKLSTFQNKYKELMGQKDEGKDPIKGALDEAGICPACQLFGCTGWGAKVILRITDRKPKEPVIDADKFIGKDETFTLKFIERRKISALEETLLNSTIKLIAEYGAIGGKTVLKPSDHNKNGAAHHKDYGIINWINVTQTSITMLEKACKELEELRKWSSDSIKDWPDLQNFWFVKGKHLNRLQINELVSRDVSNGKYNNNPTELQIFLGGFTPLDKNSASKTNIDSRTIMTTRDTESKKIFSFHGESASETTAQRCFGYTRTNDLVGFINELYKVKTKNNTTLFNNGDIKKGAEIIEELNKSFNITSPTATDGGTK